MSDPLSDIYRQEREDELFANFLKEAFSFLGKKEKSKDEKINSLIAKLKEKNKNEWIKFINNCRDLRLYKLLKDVEKSEFYPFKDQIILDVNFGYGFLNLNGFIVEEIEKKLCSQNMRIYKADRYSILLNKKDFENSEIVWRGHSSEKTPYEERKSNK